MRISEAFCKMRLSEYCTSQDVDRAIAVTVDSFVGAQKVSCKKALARAFAKYILSFQIPLLKEKEITDDLIRYTLAKPGSQRSQNGRNGLRTGAPATAVMA